MTWDDPFVWVLLITAAVLLFGNNKIPQLARSLGQARREFSRGWKGLIDEVATASPAPNSVQPRSSYSEDPLLVAARREGIITGGKTKQEIASELSLKLNQGKQKGTF